MQDAMNSAVQRVLTRMFFSPLGPTPISQFLDIHVSRDNIVEDTIRELSEHPTSDLKKPLRVIFFFYFNARECLRHLVLFNL